jgi:hypothetical protein
MAASAGAQPAGSSPADVQPGQTGEGVLQWPGDSASGAGNAPDDQEASTATPESRSHVTAVRVGQSPRLDGLLDDPQWRTAAKITNFVQQRPLEGAPATEATEVYLAYDSERMYFGIYAHYSDPGQIRANRVDRDQTGRDDTVAVFFDPFLDQQRGYVFSVNGYGVQADSLLSGPGAGAGPGPAGSGGRGGGGNRVGGIPGDPSWDALFESAGHLVEDGWTAEMAIPFKSLRYPSRRRGQGHRWGFQIQRDIESKNESVVWAPMSRDVMGFLRQMGVLDGLADLSTSRNLELLPTVTAIDTRTLDTTSGDMVSMGTREAGLSVKYGLTSNLTMSFALNPDFSQIESDRQQIEVNQRFPLFYPELRPFFLEGQEIFSVPGPITLVHTRTIVDPQFGAKLSGKIGRLTLGILAANDEAPGKVSDPTEAAFGETANVAIARLRYDVYAESQVGLLVTDREFLSTFSRVGGADGGFRLGTQHRLGFRAMASSHRDGEGVERAGRMVDVFLRKEGRHFTYGLSHFSIDPDFRNDTGFIRRVDERRTRANASVRFWPESWVISWEPRTDYSRNYDFAGTLQDEEIGAGLNVQFARSINVNVDYSHDMERYAGVDFEKTRYGLGGGVNTSRTVSFGGFISGGDQVRYVDDPYLGAGLEYDLNATVRPFSRLQAQLNLNTSRFTDVQNDMQVFNIKILRALTTYQFTGRMLVRNILEYNDYERTVGANLLLTYRVNAGTVFFVGYDDRFRQGDLIDAELFQSRALLRTNRALFAKLQVLLRY